MSLIADLKYRELIYGMTDPDLEKALDKEKLVFYMGVDPTADSLHIGHLLACLVAKRLGKHGHKPIIVIGGGTGLIGDPSFRAQERALLTIEASLKNAEGITKQVKKLLPEATVVNNYEWLSSLNAIEFLRDIGKHFNIAYMVAKRASNRPRSRQGFRLRNSHIESFRHGTSSICLTTMVVLSKSAAKTSGATSPLAWS